MGVRGPRPGEEDSFLGPRSPCSPSCPWSPLPQPPTGQDASSLMPTCRPEDTGPLSVPTSAGKDSPQGTALAPLGNLTSEALRTWPQPPLPAHRSCCISTSLFCLPPRVSGLPQASDALSHGPGCGRAPDALFCPLRVSDAGCGPPRMPSSQGLVSVLGPVGPSGLPAGTPGTWVTTARHDDQHSLPWAKRFWVLGTPVSATCSRVTLLHAEHPGGT